ncbi:hypothetical protein Ddye_000374 [Dipteronia dyeriana]|uniref:Uncharacterized protein n=1 Tax=Dipteronia dyeriana TaxID=168575 RepID=A0AAD9XLS8_9ROSI|nr:hypothetical protein Ddye_000374 [Dipteronia dyeriana]
MDRRCMLLFQFLSFIIKLIREKKRLRRDRGGDLVGHWSEHTRRLYPNPCAHMPHCCYTQSHTYEYQIINYQLSYTDSESLPETLHIYIYIYYLTAAAAAATSSNKHLHHF